MNSIKRFLCCAATVALSLPVAGLAGIVPITGDNERCLTPLFHETIRLDSTQVVIRLKPDGYTVDTTCRFFNTGETSKQLVGFMSRRKKYFTLDSDVRVIKSWLDGKEIALSDECSYLKRSQMGIRLLGPPARLIERSDWLVRDVLFPGQSLTTLRVSYEASYVLSMDGKSLVYDLGSDRFWKGTIGRAILLVDTSGVGGTWEVPHISFPMGMKAREMGKNWLAYEIGNFEPSSRSQLNICVAAESCEQSEPMQPPMMKGEMPVQASRSLRTLKGKLLSSSQQGLAIRVSENGSTQVVQISITSKTEFIPFRRPAVDETLEIEYEEENGRKSASVVRMM